MEFLLIWVLNTDIIDCGLRYNEAGECFASAQNIGKDLLTIVEIQIGEKISEDDSARWEDDVGRR